MPKTPYMKRVCDDILSLELQAAGAVLIEGAKWCGKSRTTPFAYRRPDGIVVCPLGCLCP